MDVQPHIRVRDADIRTLARLLAELVDNGILHLIGNKLGVTELLGKDYRVNGKGLVKGDVLRPVDVLDAFIDIVGRERTEALDGFQNADCGVKLEISAVHQFLVAPK